MNFVFVLLVLCLVRSWRGDASGRLPHGQRDRRGRGALCRTGEAGVRAAVRRAAVPHRTADDHHHDSVNDVDDVDRRLNGAIPDQRITDDQCSFDDFFARCCTSGRSGRFQTAGDRDSHGPDAQQPRHDLGGLE